ncbi:MAG: hypothetical protein HXS44_15580 [Theionarchaea archaeon]|nr:hypothetical protein [Theionarchaea archaeon]
MNSKTAWILMLLWFAVVVVLLCIAGEWSVVAFGITYGLGFGGVSYNYRKEVKSFFEKVHLNNFKGFLLTAVAVTITEEVYCYALGNQIANPVLWVDLILVTVMWLVWFSTWYFFLSRKYTFEEKEALLVAGSTGILYEFVGTGEILRNPFGIFLGVPLAVVIYAAIFVLPMQMIPFTGENTGKMKWAAGVLLPFMLTIPVALVLYLVLSLCGILD